MYTRKKVVYLNSLSRSFLHLLSLGDYLGIVQRLFWPLGRIFVTNASCEGITFTEKLCIRTRRGGRCRKETSSGDSVVINVFRFPRSHEECWIGVSTLLPQCIACYLTAYYVEKNPL